MKDFQIQVVPNNLEDIHLENISRIPKIYRIFILFHSPPLHIPFS